jgi:hypothetical protein
MTSVSIYKQYNEVEIFSNFFIVFYNYGKDVMNRNNINFSELNSVFTIFELLNNNEKVYILYDIESLNAFTLFISHFLTSVINIPEKKDRLNICLLNSIIVDPNLI